MEGGWDDILRRSRQALRKTSAWVARRWDESRPLSEFDRKAQRYDAEARLLEARVRRDLATKLTEAEIEQLIRLHKSGPAGMQELLDKVKQLDEEEARALAGVTDPARRGLIQRMFQAQRMAIAYRGPA